MGPEQMDFAEFYQNSRDDCLRAILANVGSRDTAEDLMAEGFARAWVAWRKVSRHPAPEAVLLGDDAPPDLPASSDTTGSVVDGRIMAALLRLPSRQREVFALRVLLDLDTSVTAEVLGIAPGTVTAHLARAVRKLRNELMPDEEEAQL